MTEKNILVVICFNGSRYHGWQIQKNALTIQEVFQNSLKKVTKCQVSELKGCSRTDAGVHANMYCLNVKVDSFFPADNMALALNRFLPSDISALNSCEVDLNFHARYSCTAKEYIYKISNSRIRNPFLNSLALHYPYKLDLDTLRRAAFDFEGEHNFLSFCTKDQRNLSEERKNFVRKIHYFEIGKSEDLVIFRVKANGFLHNMIRIMIGTLLRVAQGKIKEQEIKEILKAKNRQFAGPTVPAHGLYLNRVLYDGIEIVNNHLWNVKMPLKTIFV
ncbi:MAG: tRNA pseudouridine(38-40) synthase TruA [Oscillospiraceae bacterium]|nr:tRNA pseudouridine(38-40) synthase TruA [Oscillospiraceae bacterium]